MKQKWSPAGSSLRFGPCAFDLPSASTEDVAGVPRGSVSEQVAAALKRAVIFRISAVLFYPADSAYGNYTRLFVQLRIPPKRLLFPPGSVLQIQYGPVKNRAKFFYNSRVRKINKYNF